MENVEKMCEQTEHFSRVINYKKVPNRNGRNKVLGEIKN